jgi:hypothetical protein
MDVRDLAVSGKLPPTLDPRDLTVAGETSRARRTRSFPPSPARPHASKGTLRVPTVAGQRPSHPHGTSFETKLRRAAQKRRRTNDVATFDSTGCRTNDVATFDSTGCRTNDVATFDPTGCACEVDASNANACIHMPDQNLKGAPILPMLSA